MALVTYIYKVIQNKYKACCIKNTVETIKHTDNYEVNSPFRYSSNNNSGLYARTAADHYTGLVSFEKKVSVKFTPKLNKEVVTYIKMVTFIRKIQIILIGISAMRNFTWGKKISPCRFHNKLKLVTRFYRIDHQKTAWFESGCASYIATLLTIDNGLSCP